MTSTILAVVGVVGVVGAIAWPVDARGDERASAEELFQRGRQAMDKKDYPRACELLEASLKLEDTLGTLLNVALCHEAVGRVATAWGEFRAVEQRALRSIPPQTGRVDFARQHAEGLQPKLARLKVVLDPKIDARVVEIRVDGKLMATEALVEGTPADPGKRVVHASAPKKLPVDLTIEITPGPATVSLNIPALVDAPAPVAAPAAASARDVEAALAARGRRVAGFVTGGIGLGFVVAGGVFGALALASQGNAGCAETVVQGQHGCFTTVRDASGREQPNAELQRAQSAYDRASVFANLSTAGFVLGAIGVGVGLYLVLTAKVPQQRAALVGPRSFEMAF
jgi:hypothetical protein